MRRSSEHITRQLSEDDRVSDPACVFVLGGLLVCEERPLRMSPFVCAGAVGRAAVREETQQASGPQGLQGLSRGQAV